ncbi:MAG TPA: hypothetical protein VGE07_00520 [Herpetosiphonaceae bacterium]
MPENKKRYFKPGTLEEYFPADVMQMIPAQHVVEELPDGKYKCGIYTADSPLEAVETFRRELAISQARIVAEFANKTPIGRCHYCGQEIYDQRDARLDAMGTGYSCRECV